MTKYSNCQKWVALRCSRHRRLYNFQMSALIGGFFYFPEDYGVNFSVAPNVSRNQRSSKVFSWRKGSLSWYFRVSWHHRSTNQVIFKRTKTRLKTNGSGSRSEDNDETIQTSAFMYYLQLIDRTPYSFSRSSAHGYENNHPII